MFYATADANHPVDNNFFRVLSCPVKFDVECSFIISVIAL